MRLPFFPRPSQLFLGWVDVMDIGGRHEWVKRLCRRIRVGMLERHLVTVLLAGTAIVALILAFQLRMCLLCIHSPAVEGGTK